MGKILAHTCVIAFLLVAIVGSLAATHFIADYVAGIASNVFTAFLWV